MTCVLTELCINRISQAIAFNKRTSVLQYLVSIIVKNDKDILHVSEDFMPVRATKKNVLATISDQLADLRNGIELVNKMVKEYSPGTGNIATEMAYFSKTAESRVRQAAERFNEANSNFANLLGFFGEEDIIKPEAFFSTINKFVYMVDETSKEISRKEKIMVSYACSSVNDCSL